MARITSSKKTNFMGADPAVECGKRIWRWITDTRPETFKASSTYQAIKGKYPKMDQVYAGLRVLEEKHISGRCRIKVIPDQAVNRALFSKSIPMLTIPTIPKIKGKRQF